MSKRSSQSLAFWWWMIKLGAELKLSWLILCTLNTEIKIAATDTIAPDFFMGCWEVWLIGNYRYFSTIAQSHSPETVGIPHWNTWKISGNLQHSQLTHVNPQSPFCSDRVTPKPLHMRALEDLPAWDCLSLGYTYLVSSRVLSKGCLRPFWHLWAWIRGWWRNRDTNHGNGPVQCVSKNVGCFCL